MRINAPLGDPGPPTMLDIEAEYDRRWREAGGMARVRRTASLYASFRGMLESQVRKQDPGLSDREIAINAARRMYLSDKVTQRLLDEMEGALCTTSTSKQESDVDTAAWARAFLSPTTGAAHEPGSSSREVVTHNPEL